MSSKSPVFGEFLIACKNKESERGSTRFRSRPRSHDPVDDSPIAKRPSCALGQIQYASFSRFKPAFLLRKGRKRGVNKTARSAYNKIVFEITVSEQQENSSYITYLYNAVGDPLRRMGGRGEISLSGERAVLRLTAERAERELKKYLCEKVAEIVGVGYKYDFLEKALRVSLSKREKRLLSAALIAADFDGDASFIRRKLEGTEEFCIDGFYRFRLTALREKWAKIVDYVPSGFTSSDLKRFCDFLVGESCRKIYVKGNAVFGENFAPLRKSRLTGEEDPETEIMLSDAGYIYCLGKVEASVEDFLQKYYAERTVFS